MAAASPLGIPCMAPPWGYVAAANLRSGQINAAQAEAERADLATVYHLEERLFCLTLPRDSSLDGRRLDDAQLSDVLGWELVASVKSVSLLRSHSKATGVPPAWASNCNAWPSATKYGPPAFGVGAATVTVD